LGKIKGKKRVQKSWHPNMSKRILSTLIEIIFPSRCRACGEFFRPPKGKVQAPWSKDIFRNAMGPYLCPACADGFLPAASPLCPVCGEVFKSRQGEDHLCGPCTQSPRKFQKARAVGVYEKGLLKAIHCLKYKGRRELARPLGGLLLSRLREQWEPDEIDFVLPVPLHPKRMRTRGFNQSLLLVQAWRKSLKPGRTRTSGTEIVPGLMKRVKSTLPQTGLGRTGRMKNLRGAFVVNEPRRVENRRILLVDDVYTTGATADACAGMLLKSGAARVDVLTLARTTNR
jgi:ComF family protein